MAKRASRLILALFTLLLVGCDHATKMAVVMKLSGGDVVQVVPGVADLRYARNDAMAFSMFHGMQTGTSLIHLPALLAGIAIVVLFAVLAFWWRRRNDPSRALHVGFALIVAGAAGNVIDRVARGYVIDFIHVHYWPIFNVADVLIVAGTILIALVAQSRSASRDARV